MLNVSEKLQQHIAMENFHNEELAKSTASNNQSRKSKSVSTWMEEKAVETSVHDHLQSFVKVSPMKPQQNLPAFQRSRLLLSHLGFLTFGGLKDNSFQLLTKSPNLFRDIKGLDKKAGREAIKVALIYVRSGQEDEQSILRNKTGSAQYNQFVDSLGWEIDIATHNGYLGGLEKSLKSGSTATYYCTSTLEMIFHESTKMPTDLGDPKQVKKKRHIGISLLTKEMIMFMLFGTSTIARTKRIA